MAEEKKAVYAKPASQVDLEARRASGNKSDRVLTWSDAYEAPTPSGDEHTYAVEGNDLTGYVGVSSEYATYANETEKPGISEESEEDKVADEFVEAAGPIAQVHGSVLAEEDEKSEPDEEGVTSEQRDQQKISAVTASGAADDKAEAAAKGDEAKVTPPKRK